MKTLIAIPCMEMVHADFMKSMLELEKDGDTSFAIIKNSLIYNARNAIAGNAIKYGFDRVLWLDSDMIFPRNTLKLLSEDLDSGLDYVSGICWTRSDPSKPTLYSDLWYKVEENEASVGSKNIEEVPKGLGEIAASGFGCVMTSTTLLKKLVDRWGAPFTPMMGFGEDLAFCWRVKEVGMKMHCDGRVWCGHIGSRIYDGIE